MSITEVIIAQNGAGSSRDVKEFKSLILKGFDNLTDEEKTRLVTLRKKATLTIDRMNELSSYANTKATNVKSTVNTGFVYRSYTRQTANYTEWKNELLKVCNPVKFPYTDRPLTTSDERAIAKELITTTDFIDSTRYLLRLKYIPYTQFDRPVYVINGVAHMYENKESILTALNTEVIYQKENERTETEIRLGVVGEVNTNKLDIDTIDFFIGVKPHLVMENGLPKEYQHWVGSQNILSITNPPKVLPRWLYASKRIEGNGRVGDTDILVFKIPAVEEIPSYCFRYTFQSSIIYPVLIPSTVKKIGSRALIRPSNTGDGDILTSDYLELGNSFSLLSNVFYFEQPAGMYVDLPKAGNTGMGGMMLTSLSTMSAKVCTIYTDNEYIKNYNYKADGVNATIYHLDGSRWIDLDYPTTPPIGGGTGGGVLT